MAAPDKIGIPMEGALAAMDLHRTLDDNTCHPDAPHIVE